MKRRVVPFLAVAMGGLSLVFAVRQAGEWAHRGTSPFQRFMDEVDATLPADARVLLVIPDSARREGDPCRLNARIYPRVVYALPPGAATVEQAAAWIAEKRLAWAVSIGGIRYDPLSAYVRRLDAGR